MLPPNERQVSGVIVFIGVGAIFALLIGLVAWQPKAITWIAQAVEAESPKAPEEAAPVRLAAVPMRRPIHPDAWAQVIDSRK